MKHRPIHHLMINKAIGFFIMFSSCCVEVRTQIFSDFLPIEKAFLTTILKDTVSETYCQLPLGIKFGNGKEYGMNMILLKSGRRNIILQNGSPNVYKVISDSLGIGIKRMDQEIHWGNNFAKMAFFRKDTIFEAGGYGFWKVRDLFTYFDESDQKWKPYPGTDRFPFERFYHYFDARSDCFYLFGQVVTENSRSTNGRSFSDSMFRFSFESGEWETLGQIEPLQWATLNDPWNKFSHTFHTPFGLGGCIAGILTLRDPQKNSWYAMKDSTDNYIKRYNQEIDSVSHNYRIFIHLKDTLHIFLGEKDVLHAKVRLTRTDFEHNPSGRIYIPLDKKTLVRSAFPNVQILLIGSITMISLMITGYRLRKQNLQQADNKSDQPAYDLSDPIAPVEPNRTMHEENTDLATFLASLSSGEKALVERMYITTLQGKKMDIDSINKILGVGRKEMTVQKTRRSTAISKINESFAISLKLKNPLIVRSRDEEDKRSYTYQIAQEHMDLIGKNIS